MHSILGSGFKRRFVGLALPPLVLGALDAALTLFGQGDAYWGNHLAVNEASPFFAALLQVHPVALAAGAAAWLVMIAAMILALPALPALLLSITIVLGHTMGAGSWMFDHFELGYQLANGFYLIAGCALGLGIHYAYRPAAGPVDDVLIAPASTRLAIGGTAFALGALIFLFPWQP